MGARMYGWETRMSLKHYLEQGVLKPELSRRFGVARGDFKLMVGLEIKPEGGGNTECLLESRRSIGRDAAHDTADAVLRMPGASDKPWTLNPQGSMKSSWRVTPGCMGPVIGIGAFSRCRQLHGER